jgi:hypothetical protein
MQPQQDFSDLYTFWRGLSQAQRQEFAASVGTTYQYIDNHLIHKRKQPRKELIRNLANSSNGALTYEGLVSFFFAEPTVAAQLDADNVQVGAA